MTLRLALAALLFVGCGGSTIDESTSTTDAAADITTDGPCACIGAPLEWEENGGNVLYVDRSAVTGCNTYTQTRTNRDGATGASCSVELERCPTDTAVVRYEIPELNAVLAHADVRAAVAAAPILYGRDTRPSDGSLLQVTIAGKRIEIGEDCGSTSACTPVPAGVVALRDALRAADGLQEGAIACARLK